MNELDRATLLSDLGSVRLEQGNLTEAEANYREALAAFQNDQRPAYRERAAIALGNLALICIETGRMGEAIVYSQQARTILAANGTSSRLLAFKTLANEAAASVMFGADPGKTDALFQATLQLGEQTLGSSHHLLGQVLKNYSEFLRKTKRKREADAAVKRAKAIQTEFEKANLLGHTVDVHALRPPSCNSVPAVSLSPNRHLALGSSSQ